jgi:hypothetical protein
MKRFALVLVLTLAACLPHKHPAPTPFPALPDTVHSEAGPIPVVLVEDISVGDSTQFVIGRYDIFTRTIHTAPWYLELLCNAMAAQRVADLQRGKP